MQLSVFFSTAHCSSNGKNLALLSLQYSICFFFRHRMTWILEGLKAALGDEPQAFSELTYPGTVLPRKCTFLPNWTYELYARLHLSHQFNMSTCLKLGQDVLSECTILCRLFCDKPGLIPVLVFCTWSTVNDAWLITVEIHCIPFFVFISILHTFTSEHARSTELLSQVGPTCTQVLLLENNVYFLFH